MDIVPYRREEVNWNPIEWDEQVHENQVDHTQVEVRLQLNRQVIVRLQLNRQVIVRLQLMYCLYPKTDLKMFIFLTFL